MPMFCPYCNTKIAPHILRSYSVVLGTWPDDQHDPCYTILRCTDELCEKVFFTHFEEGKGTTFYPEYINLHNISDEIKNISPKFVEIYQECLIAEAHRLNLIVGAGYRRSLEFLIKDFAIYLDDSKEDSIKADTSLSNVINNRISSSTKSNVDTILEFANRSWWLGNDFTHYETYYTDCDLDDLKECIKITVFEINYFLQKKSLRRIEKRVAVKLV